MGSSRTANEAASGISQIASFLLDLLKPIIQSKEWYTSYLCTHNLGDIQHAVCHSREILDHASPYLSSMPTILLTVVPQELQYMIPVLLYGLAISLFRKFQQTRRDEDITKAIDMFRVAQSKIPVSDKDGSSKCITYLSLCYLVRDGNLDGYPELEASLRELGFSLEYFLDFIAPPRRAQWIEHLGEATEMLGYFLVMTRSAILKAQTATSLDDFRPVLQILLQGLEFFREWELFSSNPDLLSDNLGQLSKYLMSGKPGMQNSLEYINEAVNCSCAVLKLVRQDSPLFGDYLIHASEAYFCRSQKLRSQEDLGNAVRYATRAKKIIGSQSPTFLRCSENLFEMHWYRYQITEDMTDLNAAIAVYSEVDNADDNLLSKLGAMLKIRFERNQQYSDLEEAIVVFQKAVNMFPEDDLRRVPHVIRLITCEYLATMHLGDLKCLDRAVQHSNKARRIPGLVSSPGLFKQFAICILRGAYCRDAVYLESLPENLEFLEESIVTLRQIIGRLTKDDPDRVQALDLLSACLGQIWKRTYKIEAINEAIEIARLVIKLVEGERQRTVSATDQLGELLYFRYRNTQNHDDRDEALKILLDTFWRLECLPRHQIEAGNMAIDILSDQNKWDYAWDLSEKVVQLMVIQNGRFLGWKDKQSLVWEFQHGAAKYASIGLQAASIGLQAGSDDSKVRVLNVIKMLERCRGSILGHLIDNRTDFTDLIAAAPGLGEEFMTLILKNINTVTDPSGSTRTRVERTAARMKEEEDIRSCLEKISALDGFHDFMQGPTQSDLEAAAARGPIVIVIVSPIRSDAIIITKDASDPLLLPLPELKYQKAEEYRKADLTNPSKNTDQKNRIIREMQIWLWDNCVKLVIQKLDNLSTSGPAKHHIWWMGIGMANFLPFHAAGNYVLNARETALSRAISLYISTFKLLIHGRRKLKSECPEPDVQRLPKIQPKPRLAVIVMPSTPGLPRLRGARREAKVVKEIFRNVYPRKIFLRPSAEKTLSEMRKCEIVHFACHGESDGQDPSSSCLLLEVRTPDKTREPKKKPETKVDKLTLRQVASADLSHGVLAVLSACSTAEDSRGKIWDEGLHLVSGFQVAGFLHVVGNLSPSGDKASVQVMDGFYTRLKKAGDLGNGGNIATALNEALTNFLARKENRHYARKPDVWAQFVHFGP